MTERRAVTQQNLSFKVTSQAPWHESGPALCKSGHVRAALTFWSLPLLPQVMLDDCKNLSPDFDRQESKLRLLALT